MELNSVICTWLNNYSLENRRGGLTRLYKKSTESDASVTSLHLHFENIDIADYLAAVISISKLWLGPISNGQRCQCG